MATQPSDPTRDTHPERNLEAAEAPLDAANQSLADALRSSFGILKGIMLVLVVLYLFSNVRCIEQHEEAMVLRLGRLLPTIHQAGLVWAWPFPVDEVVTLPTRKNNDITITSHTFHRSPREVGKPLAHITRGSRQGLNPVIDGALLTADQGLVHVMWKLSYRIGDVEQYVRRYRGMGVEAAETLTRTVVETIGIHVASEMNADDVVRKRVEVAQTQMKLRTNRRLAELGTGITVHSVEMIEPTPPVQVRKSFDATQMAAQRRSSRIREAHQEETSLLSNAAGAAYEKTVALLDRLDAVDTRRAGGADVAATTATQLRDELDYVLTHDAEGAAGQLIKDAGAYYDVTVGRMEGDIEQYRTLVPEFERNADLLVARLWEQARRTIFESGGVAKIYRPGGLGQVRIKVGPDPEQARRDEATRLGEKTFDPSQLRTERMVPILEDMKP